MNVAPVRTDIVIIGAGFAGLSAAQALKVAGVDFVVLEARDRAGGRVESQINRFGERIDTGGQYICVDMPEVMALARSYGKTFVDGLHEGQALIEPAPSGAKDGLYERISAIRDRANEYEPSDPSIAGLSVRDWTDKQPDAEDAKAGFLAQIEGLWCQSVDQLPLWFLVSNDRRITNDVPELQYFLRETMHSLTEDLAAGIGTHLHLSAPVTTVRHDSGGVEVSTAAETYAARHVIIAVPPVMARRIDYRPPLPIDLGRALSVWESGKVIKALLRYPRPFWREAGLSGSVFYLDTPGFYATDASRDDAHAAMVVFMGGRLASELSARGEASVRAAIIEKLSVALGPAAEAPSDVIVRDWVDDIWSGGAYSDTIRDMNATDAEDILRAGTARIGFASSELSPSFPGYIEGAIVAGRAAADRVTHCCAKRSRYTSCERASW